MLQSELNFIRILNPKLVLNNPVLIGSIFLIRNKPGKIRILYVQIYHTVCTKI